MFSATSQVLTLLDEFEQLQNTNESPSQAQVRDLFRLRDEAKTEVAAASGSDLRTELTPAQQLREGDEFNQDAATATPRGAAPSHPAEGAARVGHSPTLDEIEDSLQRDIARGRTAAPRPRKPQRKRKASALVPTTPAPRTRRPKPAKSRKARA